MPITRMMVFSPQDSFLFEISPNSFFGGSYTEELNGPHSMELITLQKLEKEQRILFEDATEKWREYVVTGVDAKHQNGERVLGQYQMVWSLQHDLQLYTIDELAGIEDPITTISALDIVLSGTNRWTRGSVTQDALGEAEMIMKSGWECLSILLDVWGGEVDADIRVSSTNIISRRVNVLSNLGSASVTRRFDYSRDMTSIRRVVDESPIACQIIPLGKREKDIDGFDVPLTIEDVNDGKNYLRNAETAPLFRLPNGSGGWEYTEIKVDNTSIEDEEELLEWGLSVLDDYTRPKVTYEADVLQFVAAGMDVKGVELGDTVHCIDRAFGDGEIRIEGRITSVTVDLADPSKTSIKVGELKQRAFVSMMSSITSMQSKISDLTNGVTYTTEYLNNLLDHLNDEINANGGYTYITDGQGIRTYDKAVSNPLVGYEADAVVEIKGGSIRIANSKTAQGEWEWRTVFVSGHIAADMVTAASITTGYIGNASAGSYWDLDNNELRIATGAQIGDTTVGDLLQDVASSGVSKIEYGVSSSSSTAPTSWSTTVPSSVAKGSWLWIRTTYKDGGTSTTKAYAGTDGQNGADGADGSDGQDGADGVGVKSIVPQYYLSTSSTSATGGSWSNNPPTWSANHYIWTRSYITWDTTPSTTSTTTAVYDAALTQANQKAAQAIADAAEAAKVATNYLTFDSTNGLDVGYSGTNAKTRIKGDGVEIFDGSGTSGVSEALFTGTSARIGRSDKEHITITPSSGINMYDSSGSTSVLFAGVESSKSIVRVGKQTGSGNVVMSSDGYVDIRNASTIIAHFGYGQGHNYYDQTIYAPYYTLGTRKSNSAVESYSLVEGYNNSAERFCTHAEGWDNTASSDCAHVEGCDCTASHFAAHAEGENCTASGRTAHAEGTGCTASGKYSHAGGVDCKATGNSSFAHGDTCEARRTGDAAFGNGTIADCLNGGISQFVVGDYNTVSTNKIFIVGCGYSDNDRRSALTVDTSGNLWVRGSVPQSSDRRLKEHHAYLGEDACDFIRKLKPALYTKDGTRHVGFYAQDVQDAEPDEWDTVTVTSQHTDESLDFDPLTLDYTALIAPLVAYAQQLEKRVESQQQQIDQQQEMIEALTKRLDNLESEQSR